MITAIVVLLLCYAMAGCTSKEHWQAAAASSYFEYTEEEGGWDWSKQSGRSADTHAYAFTIGAHPFKFWEMQMQAQATARAITEAQYASREPVEPVIGPHQKAGPRPVPCPYHKSCNE